MQFENFNIYSEARVSFARLWLNNGFLENGKSKDLQIANMTGMLAQIQDSMTKLNNEMDYHRLEDVARFVMAKAPTKEEMDSFLSRRLVDQSIFHRVELQCVVFSTQSNRWLHIAENDTAELLTP